MIGRNRELDGTGSGRRNRPWEKGRYLVDRMYTVRDGIGKAALVGRAQSHVCPLDHRYVSVAKPMSVTFNMRRV